MDDFLVRAALAGLGVALVAGPLGCFVVWRGMSYVGETLAHTALFGVALAFLLDLDAIFGMMLAVAAAAALLGLAERARRIRSDAVLGIMASLALAGGLVLVSLLGAIRLDLFAYLFGDILAVQPRDLAVIGGGGGAALALLAWQWRPLLSATAHPDLARLDGVNVDAVNLLLMLLLAFVVAAAGRTVGILLVVALLVIPAATARRFARTPEAMAVGAALVGGGAVLAGLGGSLRWDTPAGPSIVIAAGLACVVAWSLPRRGR
jgi:zinc transport system permease protein